MEIPNVVQQFKKDYVRVPAGLTVLGGDLIFVMEAHPNLSTLESVAGLGALVTGIALAVPPFQRMASGIIREKNS